MAKINNFINEAELPEEIPKHRKKVESSKSKSYKKSKHKHDYVRCVFDCGNNWLYDGSYCKICGKIGNMTIITVADNNHMFHRMLNRNEELPEEYRGLERIRIDNIWQSYIPVSVSEE